MWIRHWPYAACFVAGMATLLLIQASWRHGRPDAQAHPAPLDLSVQAQRTYRVLRVIDGDTLALENGLHVRYAGINTPEKGRFVSDPAPLADAATARNRALVEGCEVRLHLGETPIDAYGRVVAHIVTVHPDGTEIDVEATLLREGLGRVMGLGLPSDEYHRLKELQEEARKAKRGIWGIERTASNQTTAPPFCAASSGRIIHRSNCPQAERISPANRVGFATFEEAQASGRQPCRQCLPAANYDEGHSADFGKAGGDARGPGTRTITY